MHRVSRMNRNKTKEMMKDFFLPSFDDDFSDLIQRKSEVSSSFKGIHQESNSPFLLKTLAVSLISR